MVKKRKISFRHGSGETVSLCAFAIFISGLFIVMLSLIQFKQAANDITKTTETSARAAALCTNIDDAKEQALRIAKTSMTNPSLSNISVSIDPATDDDEWVCGNYFYVTVKAYIKTIEPYFTSKEYGKKTLICVELKAPEKLYGNSTAEQAFNYLTSHGFSDAAAAGIIGNFAQECGGTTLEGINHTTSGKGAAGIAQWTPASQLFNAATEAGREWTDLSFQLEYLVKTIPQNWYGAQSSQTQEYINAGIVKSGITYAEFTQMTDPSEAARVFCAYYEQCHLRHANLDAYPLSGSTREENARRAYSLWH